MMRSRILLLLSILTVLVSTVGGSVWAQAGTPPSRVEVLQNARLRAGPSTSAAIAGNAQASQEFAVKACNAACDWYQLESGAWIAAFLVKAAAGAAASTTVQRPGLTALTSAIVVDVIDGDTIDVRIGSETKRVRYIGMDTPERGGIGANEATAANEELVAGGVVLLEKDVSETDRSGRLLRHVWLPGASGELVNAELVRQGWASSVAYPPDLKYQDAYDSAQAEARKAGIGIWRTSQARPAAVATARPTVRPAGATANRGANLRGGPGTNYVQRGAVAVGQALSIVGRNAGGDWYQLANGAWIAGFLVSNAPANLPVMAAPPVPAPAVPLVATVAPAPAPARGNCDPSYPTVCIPPSPPDLDCGDVGYRRFQVLPPDPHRFDGDYDGVGCESG